MIKLKFNCTFRLYLHGNGILSNESSRFLSSEIYDDILCFFYLVFFFWLTISFVLVQRKKNKIKISTCNFQFSRKN